MPKREDPTPAFTPFNLTDRYVDVACDLLGYEGFTITCRLSLSSGERKVLETAIRARLAASSDEEAERIRTMQGYQSAIAVATEAGDMLALEDLTARMQVMIAELSTRTDRVRIETQSLAAPFIRSWNVFSRGLDGAGLIEVLPPSIGGVDSFGEIDVPMSDWIIATTIGTYRTGRNVKQPTAPGAS